MTRLLLIVAVLLGTVRVAGAQPGAAAPALSPTQASQVLDLLRDDAKRTQLIGVLESLARMAPSVETAKPEAQPAPTAPAQAVPTQPVPTEVPPAHAATQAAPAQTAPAQTAPIQMVPVQLVPVQANPAPAASTNAPAGEATSPHAAPVQMVPVQMVPVQTVPAAEAPAHAPETKLPNPLVPDSLGARLLVDASDGLSELSSSVSTAVRSVTNFHLIWLSLSYLVTDPWSRDQLLDAGWKLVVVLAGAVAAERLTRQWLRRYVQRSEAEIRSRAGPPGPDGPAGAGGAGFGRGRLRFILARFALELLPVLSLIVVGYAVLGTPLGARQTTRFVILAVLHAYALLRLVFSLSDQLLAPQDAALRLVRLSDEAAARVGAWVHRIAAVGISGYVLAEVGLLFGLYRVVHEALLKIVALIVHLMLIVVVLENRAPIAAMIRARSDATGPFVILRRRLASFWHLIASFYILAVWLVWAFDVPDGFSRLLRLFVAALVITMTVRLLISRGRTVLRTALGTGPDAQMPPSYLQRRIGQYESLLVTIWAAVVMTAGVVALLEIMGVDALAWFQGDQVGARLIWALRDMTLAVLVAIVVWEVANASMQRHLLHLTKSAEAARSARLRTLLPIFRAGVLFLVCVVAGLVVLSEIGVNTAPLLAGAGVLGVAIGFGSQKLVQDVITGLFLLLENAMQVGDVVTLGGLTGTVENLSVRTIRLRAIDGSVHLIPFSAVTTVTNQTRDFSYVLLDLNIGLNQDPDRIGDLLRDIAKTMRAEARWRGAIRDDIEVMGVDRFIPTAWVMRARLKTLPGQQWAVGRELNRRIKQRFDELAIDSPLTSYKALGLQPPAPMISFST